MSVTKKPYKRQQQQQQQQERPRTSDSSASIDAIHGLLSSIGQELNIPASTGTHGIAINNINTATNTGREKNTNTPKAKAWSSSNEEKNQVKGIPYNSVVMLTTNQTRSVVSDSLSSSCTRSSSRPTSAVSKINEITPAPPTRVRSQAQASASAAQLSGRKLSLAHEHFIIIPVSTLTTSTSSPTASSASVGNTTTNTTTRRTQYVHYHDKIVLFNTGSKALGVNKKEQIGFWRSIIGEAEQWTIVPTHKYHTGDDNDNDFNQRIVDAGSNILLKNELNGKFLSFAMINTTTSNTARTDPVLELKGLIWNDIDDDDIRINLGHDEHNDIIDSNDDDGIQTHQEEEHQQHSKLQTKSISTMIKTVQYTSNQIFTLVKINTPPCPSWILKRPYLNGTYLSYSDRHQEGSYEDDLFGPRTRVSNNTHAAATNTTSKATTKAIPLWKLDTATQDLILVEELLDILIGLEGSNIVASTTNTNKNTSSTITATTPAPTTTQFILQNRSNYKPNIRCMVEKVLPTASAYVQINSFISKRLVEYDFGIVSHALCNAIDELIKDYLDFIELLHAKYRQRRNQSSTSSTATSSSSSLLTLSGLYGELQPSILSMNIILRIVNEVQYSKGGALLNKVEDLLLSEYFGDDRAQKIFSFLYEKAATPFMDMLSGWVEGGSLHDPYCEFMIEEKRRDMTPLASAGVDALEEDSLSWKNWYILREEHVLNVMKYDKRDSNSLLLSGGAPTSKNVEKSGMTMKILTAGKYWNAISHCHHRDKRAVQLASYSPRGVHESSSFQRQTIPKLTFGMIPVELVKYIDHEYTMASSTFFNIVMRDYQTRDVLAFMKRYFLLDQGDFFVHFLDMAEDELLQEMTDVSRSRVQNWMTLSIQMSGGAGGDFSFYQTKRLIFDFVESLKGEFAANSLINDLDELHAYDGGIQSHEPKTPSRQVYGDAKKGLTGVEAFMLDFHQMPFPLSLILSRSTIRNYQLMFRHLFFAKHVERRLVGTWLDHQTIKEYTSLRKDMGKTYCLRQRMLHFMQNFVYYMMFEVIEPNFLEMDSNILNRNLEEINYEKKQLNSNHQQHHHTVDDLLNIHDEFVRKTLKECLLTNRELIRTLTKLMTTCLLFSDQMKLFMDATKINEEQSSIATEARQKRTRNMYETAGILNERKEKKIREALMALSQHRNARKQKQVEMLRRELKTESYQNMISRFEQVFNSNLSEFMTQLMADSEGRYHTHLANLCIRLDYNGYVTRSMNIKPSTK